MREATTTQNLVNRTAYRCSELGIKGVRYQCGKYEAHITVNKKQVYLGRFKTAEEAVTAHNAAAEKHYGEFAVHLRPELNP